MFWSCATFNTRNVCGFYFWATNRNNIYISFVNNSNFDSCLALWHELDRQVISNGWCTCYKSQGSVSFIHLQLKQKYISQSQGSGLGMPVLEWTVQQITVLKEQYAVMLLLINLTNKTEHVTSSNLFWSSAKQIIAPYLFYGFQTVPVQYTPLSNNDRNNKHSVLPHVKIAQIRDTKQKNYLRFWITVLPSWVKSSPSSSILWCFWCD